MLSSITSVALRSSTGKSLLAKTALRSSSVLATTTNTSRFGAIKTIIQAPPQQHWFSSDSHDDFAAKKKPVDTDDEAMEMIKSHVEGNPVMLYMKGNPSQPMCGFSATVVGILQKEGIDFSSVNVLDYPAIREGVKKYSEWPTIPQLYVNGEFIGGCDIITSMHESGELKVAFEEGKK